MVSARLLVVLVAPARWVISNAKLVAVMVVAALVLAACGGGQEMALTLGETTPTVTTEAVLAEEPLMAALLTAAEFPPGWTEMRDWDDEYYELADAPVAAAFFQERLSNNDYHAGLGRAGSASWCSSAEADEIQDVANDRETPAWRIIYSAQELAYLNEAITILPEAAERYFDEIVDNCTATTARGAFSSAVHITELSLPNYGDETFAFRFAVYDEDEEWEQDLILIRRGPLLIEITHHAEGRGMLDVSLTEQLVDAAVERSRNILVSQ